MKLFRKKSDAEKARKKDKKEAKRDARERRQEARKDAREERRENRKEAKTEKQDARKEKRDAIRDIRRSDLSGKDKRAAKKEARQEKRDAIDLAQQDKRDNKQAIREEKRQTLVEIREEKRKKLRALRVPKASNRRWNSYLRFQEVEALEIYKPETLAHLKVICRIATEEGLTVRAIGSGHSFSNIGVTDDIFILTDSYDAMLPMSQARRRKLKQGRRSGLAEFEVGRTIIDISKELEKTGQALRNQGTYDGQTFWGAVSTSTHGSGLGRGPFPDMVLSFVMVGEGGRTYRIEPSDGITNPNGWSERGVDELIQDDDTFFSAVCSFGSMGVVYSAVISARDFYWLDEWTFLTTWQDFTESFPRQEDAITFIRQWDTISFLVSPMIAKSGGSKDVDFKDKNPMSMTVRLRTPDDMRRRIGGRSFDTIAKAFENVGIITGNAPAEGGGWTVNELLPGDAWIAKTATRGGVARGWMGEALDPDTIRDDIPIKRRNKCYKIFPKGGKLFGGYGIELAFPLHRIYDVMDRIIALAEENRDDRHYHTAPVAVRFVAPSRALVSPQYNQETVMFEVLMAKGTKGGADALRRIEEQMISDPDIRIHWGLNLDVMRSVDMENMYGENWQIFSRIFRRFNARRIFANDFTDRIGL